MNKFTDMINASELRPGNVIFYNDPINGTKEALTIDAVKKSIASVQKKHDSGIELWLPLLNCEPIPLTHEWLKSCGFKEEMHKNSMFRGIEDTTFGYKLSDGLILVKNTIRDASGEYDGFLLRDNRGIRIGIQRIKYVHRLQNIYLDLTEEELTIKETA